VMSVNRAEKEVSITDYKTGKPAHSWNGKSDFEKISYYLQKCGFFVY